MSSKNEPSFETQPIALYPVVRLSLPLTSPICWPCAEETGGAMPDGHMATAWEDACCVCGDFKSVTAVSDWRWTRKDSKQAKSRTGPKLRRGEEQKREEKQNREKTR